MKILIITTTSTLAGTEKNIYYLAKFLHANGNIVHVVTLKGNGELIELLTKEGILAENLNIKKILPLGFLRLRSLMRKGNYDIINAFLFHSIIPSRIFKPKNIVLINSIRSENKWEKWYHYLIESLTNKKVDGFTVNFSDFDKYKKKHHLNNIYFIPNGVIAQKENFSQVEPFIIKMIGRFHSVKQHIPLMQAFIKYSGNKDFKFIFIGRGPLKNKISKFIEQNNLKNNFSISDFIHDEKMLYKNTSIVISVSKYEGFPNTLLEANSFGIPVVSFNVGAASDLIINGENGFIVSDFQDLFKKLSLIKNDRELYKKMSLNAKKIAGEKYSFNKISEEYLKFYDSFLRK